MEEQKKPLVYEDKETKQVLYGFSNYDIKKLYTVLWVLIILLAIGLAILIYVLWKIEAYNIVGKFLSAIRTGGML